MSVHSPCRPNCEHKPSHIKSEGCGAYHDDCPVYKKWKRKYLAWKHLSQQKELMPDARTPVKTPRKYGKKNAYYGG